jgi:hypothetical protein
MRTMRIKCRHCRRLVSQGKPGQKYCGRKVCQRARKRQWSRSKYGSDPDYRLNQKESTQAWLKSRGGAAQYYREYRRRKRRLRVEMQEAAAAALRCGACETAAEAAAAVSIRQSGGAENSGTESIFAPNVGLLTPRANRDAGPRYSSMESGIYEILPIAANKDAIMVKMRMISSG